MRAETARKKMMNGQTAWAQEQAEAAAGLLATRRGWRKAAREPARRAAHSCRGAWKQYNRCGRRLSNCLQSQTHRICSLPLRYASNPSAPPESKDVHPRTNILRPSLGQKLATSSPPGQDTRWATRLPEQWQEELWAPNTAADPQTYQDGDRRRNQRKAARRPRDTGTLPREAPTRPKAREHCPRRGSPCRGAGDQQSHGMLSPELPRGGSRARPVAASLGDTLSLHKLHLDEAVFWVPWRTPSPPGPSPEATTQRSSRGQAPRPGGLLGKLEPITSPPAQCFQLHLRSATLRPLGRRTPRQSRWLGVTACPPPGLLGAGPCTEQGSRTRDGK